MTSLAARAMAPLRPLPTPADPRALRAMQDARLRSAVLWLVAGLLGAHLAGLQWPAFAYGLSGWVWIALMALVALAMLAAGFGQLVLLARAEQSRVPVATTVGALATVGLLLAPAAGLLTIMLGLVHLLLPVAVGTLGIALLALDPTIRAGAGRPVRAVVAGASTAGLLVAAGVVDALVLLPVSMVPGMPLPEIYDALATRGEDGGVWVPFAWAGVWLVAIALLALGLVRNRRSARGALGTLLAAGAVSVLALPVVEFSLGMGIGDALATQGGMSAAFPVLSAVATLLAALAAALLIGARPAR